MLHTSSYTSTSEPVRVLVLVLSLSFFFVRLSCAHDQIRYIIIIDD